MPSRLGRLVIACLVLPCLGCGGDNLARQVAPASGRVTVKGQPLTQGVIIFVPDAARGNDCLEEGRSPIFEDGTYEMETREYLGAPRGWCKVVIVARIDPESSTSSEPARWFAHEKYALPGMSGLAVEVLDSNPTHDFDLEPPAPEKPKPPPQPAP